MDGGAGASGLHAAEHPNQAKERFTCEYEGVTYITTPAFLEAARQTFHELDQMPDVKATFYGEGLVQEMAKRYVPKPRGKGKPVIGFSKPELISEEYRRLNAQLHQENMAYGVGAQRHVQSVIKLAEALKTKCLLDYGSGKGLLGKGIPWAIAEYDPAVTGKEESPKPADIVACFQVLEHVEPDKLLYVLDDLKRCVLQVGYFIIDTGPAQKHYANGCLYRSAQIETEVGRRSIRWIVSHKYGGRVLAFDVAGDFTWGKVLNHWSRNNDYGSGKAWVMVVTSGNRGVKRLRCTEDHPCFALENPLLPRAMILAASDLPGNYLLRRPTSAGNCPENALYNAEQLSVLLGTVVGDGHIDAAGKFIVNHGNPQRDYIQFKHRLLGGSLVPITPNRGCYSKETSYRLSCPVNGQTKLLRTLVYPSGQKTTLNILKYLDERSLAFWYMDDGSLLVPECNHKPRCHSHKNNAVAIFCTDDLTHHEQSVIQGWLRDRFDITASIYPFHKKYFRLHLSVDGSERLFDLIAPYVPECMEYKLPPKFHGRTKHTWNAECLHYAASLVSDVKIMPRDIWHSSKLYDIEVEGLHNFVGDGAVVHNSNTHLIQKDKAWWTKRLKKFFTVGSIIEVPVGPPPKNGHPDKRFTELHVVVGRKQGKAASNQSLHTSVATMQVAV